MTVYQDFLAWQERLLSLEQEGAELGRRIEELEQQNVSLQQRLLSGHDPGSGFEALSSLYDEGFHICPANFGQARDEDCLFCLNFLHHKGKRE